MNSPSGMLPRLFCCWPKLTSRLLPQQLLPPFADEPHHESGPAGLVGGAEAFPGFGVEVLVEEKEVLPVGFLRVAGGVAETGAVSVLAGEEEGDEAVAEVD